MSNKIVQDGVMYLKNIILFSLPDNFKTEYSLDCSDSDITCLPEGLEVGGNLILGNSRIEDLPARLVVGGDVIMKERELLLPKDAIVGGTVVTPNNCYTPPLPEGHYVITDTGITVIYKNVKFIVPEEVIEDDFYYPQLRYYKNINLDQIYNAVQYTEHGFTYTFSCTTMKDAKYQVDWHRGMLNGMGNYTFYNIDEPRPVSELIEIYEVCTGACRSGIDRFLKECNIDLNKMYTIREVRNMVLHLPFFGGTSKYIFLDFFAPESGRVKEEAR